MTIGITLEVDSLWAYLRSPILRLLLAQLRTYVLPDRLAKVHL